MNATFKVRTLFNCDVVEDYKQTNNQDPLWMQTLIGCRLLLVLKDMYGFNITYIIPDTQPVTGEERALSVYPQVNDSVEIYAKPMGLNEHLLDISCPIAAIYTGRCFYPGVLYNGSNTKLFTATDFFALCSENYSVAYFMVTLPAVRVVLCSIPGWSRYGFILKRPYTHVLRSFYSLPFTRPVWNCCYLTTLIVSGFFYYFSRWEKKILGGYSCYHYELLLAIGACCQHILPLQANLLSRRIAYFSFIMSFYVMNCFYSSNLLSHLVSDKDNSMDLHTLANSDYECVILGAYNASTHYMTYKVQPDTNLEIIQNKLSRAKYMDLVDGLNDVMTTRTALLSDYFVAYPVIVKMYEPDDICQLIEVDLYSNIKKYFYTSKNFSYKNEFRVGVLRLKETGVLQRIILGDVIPPINCAYTYPMQAEFEQIVIPVAILICSYTVATFIMLIERWHYWRYKVLPYVD